jgi:hypothetical protein
MGELSDAIVNDCGAASVVSLKPVIAYLASSSMASSIVTTRDWVAPAWPTLQHLQVP